MEIMFFDNWDSLFRTFYLTILGYFAMIILLRSSGKRTLSKMNAFDFVITIALGSCMASLSLNKNVSLADGILAFTVLIFLQYLLTWLSVRNKKVRSIITSSPTLIFYKGEFLQRKMKNQRITNDEVYCAGRQKGLSNLDKVDMIILEATGDITIIEKNERGKLNTTVNLEKHIVEKSIAAEKA